MSKHKDKYNKRKRYISLFFPIHMRDFYKFKIDYNLNRWNVHVANNTFTQIQNSPFKIISFTRFETSDDRQHVVDVNHVCRRIHFFSIYFPYFFLYTNEISFFVSVYTLSHSYTLSLFFALMANLKSFLFCHQLAFCLF